MDSFDFNKLAGGVLSALLLAFGSGTIGEMFGGGGHGGGHGDDHGKPGYVLPVTGGSGGGAAAKADEAFNPATVLAALKTASAENGQDVFKRCTACHTPDKDGKPGTGPNLWGIVGRGVGTSATFPRYSAALKGKGGNWDFQMLASYLNDPKATIPGNQMAFAGVKTASELSDLLAYLRTLSDKPVALP